MPIWNILTVVFVFTLFVITETMKFKKKPARVVNPLAQLAFPTQLLANPIRGVDCQVLLLN